MDLDLVPVAPARKKAFVSALSDGKRIGLAMTYFDGASALMRKAGAAWLRPKRMWVLPVTRMRQALEVLKEEAGAFPTYDLDVREVARVAFREAEPDAFTALLDLQLLPLSGGGYACTGEFDPLVNVAMRELRGTFHRPSSAWEVRCTKDDILSALGTIAGVDPAYVFVHDQAVFELEDADGGGKLDSPLSVPGCLPMAGAGKGLGETGGGVLTAVTQDLQDDIHLDESLLADLAKRCSLRDYQVDGVRFLTTRSSALLGDDMGVGKTRQAIVAGYVVAITALLTKGRRGKVLVACPASLSINWAREIQALFPTDVIAMVGEEPSSKWEGAHWIIANYERLAGLVRAVDLDIVCMLVDEAHYLKECTAGRTRNAFILAERIERRFLLTGTPVLNREGEMHTLMRLSGHPLGKLTQQEFRKKFSGSSEARAQLAEQLPSWMLRRGKDMLKDLGKKIQQITYIQPDMGLAGYHEILRDSTIMPMAKITKLREHLELLKIDFIVDAIASLPPNEKALVFCEFTGSVDLLRGRLQAAGVGAVTLTGSDSTKRRMKAVDDLQKDDGIRAFIGTTKAAGVGLTLTRANYVFMASLPWTNALRRQAEDRAYRSGNTRDVFVIVPIVANTLDEKVIALLDSKEEIEDDLVEAVRVTVH